jgi:hypothetical protein
MNVLITDYGQVKLEKKVLEAYGVSLPINKRSKKERERYDDMEKTLNAVVKHSFIMGMELKL